MIAIPVIPARLRRPLIWAGYPAFALAVALVTVYLSIPRDKVKDRLESTLSADPMTGAPGAIGMDVTIGDLGLTLFTGAGVKLKDVVLRSRPMNPTDKPARYLIDDATIHVGLIGLLFNRPTYSFKAHGLSGTVTGEISFSPSEQRIKIEASGVVITGVSAIAASVGLPVEGTISGKLDAVAPKNLAANLDGTLELAIDDAVVGDGKAKLTVPGDPFLAQGITFPKLRLGRMAGQIIMEKGRARIENVRVHSADGDATLEGFVDLHDPLGMSTMHGYLKFKPADALLKREPTVELMNNALAQTAKRPDGFIGFQLSGPLTSIFYLPNANPPAGVVSKSTPPPTAPSAPSTPVILPQAPGASPTMHLPPPPPPAPSEPEPNEPPPPAPAPAPSAPPQPSALPPPPVGPPPGMRGTLTHPEEVAPPPPPPEGAQPAN